MDTERWLAPLVGAIAIGSALLVVGVYSYGLSLPTRHDAMVSAEVPGPPEDVFRLVADPSLRTAWSPVVARIGRVEDDRAGRPVWRALDDHDDRFEFAVVSADLPTFVVVAHKPEEIGMEATWTWTVEPGPNGSVVSLREEGRVPNPLFRGVWGFRSGPYAQIEADLAAFAVYAGGDGAVERR